MKYHAFDAWMFITSIIEKYFLEVLDKKITQLYNTFANKTLQKYNKTCNGGTMNKEEVLRKNRELKKDEGIENAENKGRMLGKIVICLVVSFECFFSLFTKQDASGILLIFFAFITAEAIPLYRFTHRKTYLITIIFGTVASLSFLVSYILPYVR